MFQLGNKRLQDHNQHGALTPLDWEDCEDDAAVEMENELLEVAQTGFTTTKDMDQSEYTSVYRKRLQKIFLGDWKYFNTFWSMAIDNFWRKIATASTRFGLYITPQYFGRSQRVVSHRPWQVIPLPSPAWSSSPEYRSLRPDRGFA